MTRQEPRLQLLNAAKAACQAIAEATDTMHYEDGQAVTALDGWQIERIYSRLCSVLVELDEAIAATGSQHRC